MSPQKPRRTKEQIAEQCGDWAACGKGGRKSRNIATSLFLQSDELEELNDRLQAKYRVIEQSEVRYEEFMCDDAEIVLVAYGTVARIAKSAVSELRAKGIKAGLIRPITLYPFPSEAINAIAAKDCVKSFITTELSMGQMIEDVKLAVNGLKPVDFYGRTGGNVMTPEDLVNYVLNKEDK